jgi:hypothetical protein
MFMLLPPWPSKKDWSATSNAKIDNQLDIPLLDDYSIIRKEVMSMRSTDVRKLILSFILGFLLLQGCAVSVRGYGHGGYYYYHHPYGRHYYYGYWR